MSDSPRVSIGMPVFNGAKWLPSTIQSVLAQTAGEMELVISDNASTDETEAVCLELCARDPRVRYSRNQENIGIANNFNKAFHLSRGKYFKWMSCGDLIDRTFVEKCTKVLDSRPDVVLASPATRLFVDDPGEGEDPRDAFDSDVEDPVVRFVQYTMGVALNNVMHGLYRADALGRTGLYRTFIGADYNMIAEVLLYGRLARLDDVLNFRRMRRETATKFLSEDELRAVYAPKRPSRLTYQEWRRVLDYYSIVLRGPLTPRQRIRLLGFLTRRTLWMRGVLLKELADDLFGRRARMRDTIERT